MTIMRKTHDVAKAVDVELLRLFDALHRERHVTRAARVSGLSQPAMSRALGRMRAAWGDELFVRTPSGMVPTPRADELAPAVRRVLEGVLALARPATFDPAKLVRDFAIAAVDMFDADMLPRLARALEKTSVNVALRPLTPDSGELLARGALDLVIGVRPSLPADAIATHLFDEDFVCAVRRDHPRVGRKLSLSTFVELPHLLIAPRGDPGSTVDAALAARGLRRRVAVRTHTFQSAPLVVARSDLVLTAPRRLLAPVAKAFGLRLLPPPIELRSFGVFQAWHPRVQNDPMHAWFRGIVAAAARG
jgi:DNA-binding transcriptional LysR family regulator